jgi:predicted acylesterase/phospholipase RssA
VAFLLHSSAIDDIVGVNESLADLDVLARRLVGERTGRGVAKMAIGLVLGGGAPNLPLMTGALLALDEAGVDFKVITTTGAGMVVGLLYAAPRKKKPSDSWVDTRRAALRATRDWGIDDLIHEMIPVNYKIFQKPGVLAQAFSHATNPFLWSIPRESRRQRLLGDTLALVASAMSPSNLKASSKGLCQPPPWIEMLVNFDELEKNLADPDIRFRLSAYCIEDSAEKTFRKHEITADHFKAALAMPFIYAPYKLKGEDGTWKTYLEGSAFNTLAFPPDGVMMQKHIDTVIFFDIMGNRHLIGEPRWLIDAWGKSIVAPLTRLAEQGLDSFKMKRDLRMKDLEIKRLDELLELAATDPKHARLAHELHKKTREFKKLAEVLGLAEQDIAAFKTRCDEYLKSHQDKKLERLMGLAETDLKQFKKRREEYMRDLDAKERQPLRTAISKQQKPHHGSAHGHRVEFLRMRFRDHIPKEHWPKVLDWSYSNMSKLFDIGVKTGKDFVEKHGERLEGSMKAKLN